MFKFLKTAINNAVENVAPLMRNNRATAEHAWSKIQEEYNKLIASPQLGRCSSVVTARSREYDEPIVVCVTHFEEDHF